MIREAKALREAARISLRGKWGNGAVLALIYVLLMGLPGMVSEWTQTISLLLLPMVYGMYVAFLDLVRTDDKASLAAERLFDGFRQYGRMLGTILLVQIYTFLWLLLLIIPGVVKALSYSMTCFILKDYPELEFNEAINLSMAMMKGHRFDLFYLYLTFIGWALLAFFTLGIGYFWLIPYMQASIAHFYIDVKAEYVQAQAQVQA